MGASIDFSGLGNLVEELELKVNNASAVENAALKAAAQPILEEAQNTTAFIDHSGKLRDSLKMSSIKKVNGVKTIQDYSSDPVAHLVEYGHGGPAPAAPHPFLEPAYNHHAAEAKEIIKQMLAEALKK